MSAQGDPVLVPWRQDSFAERVVADESEVLRGAYEGVGGRDLCS